MIHLRINSVAPVSENDLDLEHLRPRLRLKVSHELGFACPDIDDVVQESLRRFIESMTSQRLHTPEAKGAFLIGICRNVILEYRRKIFRDLPMPEIMPEPKPNQITPPELLEMREAIEEGMRHLSARDAQVLRMFYLEERTVPEILKATSLTEATFRVVLCRAKARFRQIYVDACNNRTPDVNKDQNR